MTTTTPLHEWIISSIYYSGEGGCVCIVTVGYLEPTSSYDESCTVHLNNEPRRWDTAHTRGELGIERR